MNWNTKSLVLNVLAILLVIFLIWQATSILVYVLIATGFSIIGNKWADRLEKIKIRKKSLPRWASALIIISGIYSILITIFILIIPPLSNQIESLSNIDSTQLLANLESPISNIEHKIQIWTGDHKFNLMNTLQNQSSNLLNFGAITNGLGVLTAAATSFVFAMFSITFITFFLIKDGDLIYTKLLDLLSDNTQIRIEKIINNSIIHLRKYFIGVAIETIILTVLLSVSLWIAGIEQFFVIALVAAMLNIIPYVGPISAMLFASIIIIAGNHQLPFETELLPLLGKTILIMTIIHFIDSMFLQPYIYSSIINAHPLEIFLVILISGSIGGIIAMIFAIPSYTILRIVISELKSKAISE